MPLVFGVSAIAVQSMNLKNWACNTEQTSDMRGMSGRRGGQLEAGIMCGAMSSSRPAIQQRRERISATTPALRDIRTPSARDRTSAHAGLGSPPYSLAAAENASQAPPLVLVARA
ncbi:hypothetical protein WOLCODRAFT_166570 [Wolfiporia cocos MD-104 SS10]|uniref:Uncharacterized protein n=1 Tax=Wolfiporia cocos (strain MD-104) TaxID=742152 RepID=A0A2H3JB35_WOLCO|nr:hypothetical protein WOLCODRAFT_166570 [Wolfiporia cocos MD-104 SS10]